VTPEGDLILELVIRGEEIDDEQMEELLILFQDYDSGSTTLTTSLNWP
jgi:hypothetical protein